MDDNKKLNREQLWAVKYKGGPLLIIAGAGTGKTTVITERIKYIIEKNLAKPSEILALTFTEKAAREMEERVDLAMPYGYTQMWISTFHSFCDKILRREALNIGLDPRYKLNTQSESILFISKNLFLFDLDYFRPLGNPTKFISGMIQHFSRLQDEDTTPNEYLVWTEKLKNRKTEEQKIEVKKWKELANAYKKYDELKVKEGVMDFGDLIVRTLELFRKRPNVLKEYKKQFKYILVDEFQDTNISQNELVKLLSGKDGNITVVLDDDQSIYRFRGAAVSNALYFRKNFSKAKIITLTKNYRSHQQILDTAYQLIQHNNPDRLEVIEKINKKLVSQGKFSSGNIERLKLIHKDRVENEADEVAKEIKKLIIEEGFEYKDIAVLVRANNHADPFMRAFSRYTIPYQFLGPGRLFRQPEIIDLISYLKVLYDFTDSVSMHRLLSMEYFNIDSLDLIKIGNYSKKKNISIFEACQKINDVFVGDKTKESIKRLVEIIEKHQKLIRKETAGQLLYYFLENTGLIPKLLDPDGPEAEKRAKNISKLFDKIKTFEVDHDNATVTAVVDWIDLSQELGESPLASDVDWNEINAVNILTVHSSKGLEFPVVFLVNLVSQRFPTTERREQIPIPEVLIKEVLPKGDYHIEEERRLFYVGITRAKERVYLTASDYYGEGKREKKLSPFIFDALGVNVASSERPEDKDIQLSFLDYKSQTELSEVLVKEGPPTPPHVDFLSYSQIETFRICPLHYKLKYIYKLPTPPSSSQSFGNTFHMVMKEFYEEMKKGEKATVKLMDKLLEKNWIGEGYNGKEHEKKSFEKAQKFLKYYLDNYYDPKIIPITMEQPFVVRFTDADKRLLAIGGKVDRLDRSNNTAQIIDYKTGATPLTQKQADEDLQLSIYALAATQIPEYPFNQKPEDVKLSLMYFDTPQIVTTTRTKDQLEEAKKMLFDYKKQIEDSDFTCSGNMLCDKCEYRLFCGADG